MYPSYDLCYTTTPEANANAYAYADGFLPSMVIHFDGADLFFWIILTGFADVGDKIEINIERDEKDGVLMRGLIILFKRARKEWIMIFYY